MMQIVVLPEIAYVYTPGRTFLQTDKDRLTWHPPEGFLFRFKVKLFPDCATYDDFCDEIELDEL